MSSLIFHAHYQIILDNNYNNIYISSTTLSTTLFEIHEYSV